MLSKQMRGAHLPPLRPWPKISVEKALARICSNSLDPAIDYFPATEIASGRILAQDIDAVENVPSVPTSMKDGYAVIAADGAGERKVIGVSYAGSPFQGHLSAGSCIKIGTGAQLPENADAVIGYQDAMVIRSPNEHDDAHLFCASAVNGGDNIFPPGSEMKRGDLVIKKGSVMGPVELGVLLSCGWARRPVAIYRIPTLCVLSMGKELVEAAADNCLPGQVRDTNRPQLMALFTEAGFKPIDAGIASDSREQLIDSIKTAFSLSNTLVTTGSVSMGEKDLLKEVLVEDFKFTIHFGGVFIKPGLPCTFASGIYNDQKFLVFALPGNPVSSWCCANLFVLPSMFLTAGRSKHRPTSLRVRVTDEIVLDEHPQYFWAQLQPVRGNYPEALIAGNKKPYRLMSAKGANILLKIPGGTDERPTLAAGTLIEALVIGRI